ncbi:MAG TPA: DUF3291 domain-containing protein [Acidimicrobiia bacterium]|nr:DUF3291 domain-containing protein [Acidimicrobiia bacterium]
MGFHLAQCNVGRVLQPLEHEDMAEFVAALDPINAIAESSPGFVWRLKDDDGQSSSYVDIPGSDDPLLIINYSIWADLNSLKHFVNRTGHVAYLRRRREWFEKLDVHTSVAWWVAIGAIPDVAEAYRRVLLLQEQGPTQEAFTLARPAPMPAP